MSYAGCCLCLALGRAGMLSQKFTHGCHGFDRAQVGTHLPYPLALCHVRLVKVAELLVIVLGEGKIGN
jgi:hypothetical protein